MEDEEERRLSEKEASHRNWCDYWIHCDMAVHLMLVVPYKVYVVLYP